MKTQPIAITGAAGFIGSQIAAHFASHPLYLVDKHELFTNRPYTQKLKNVASLIPAQGFFDHLPELPPLSWIIHMGAITNTGERNLEELKKWNTDYTRQIWNFCSESKVNLIYASSAATYGDGALGFDDDVETLKNLKPLNPYGQSKQDFDVWALEQVQKGNHPPLWYGLKFFNVFGPNEDHKGRMASAIWHGFKEIATTGAMTLFRSHNPKFKDGEQARDFIFVEDVLSIIEFLKAKNPASSIYNCGTGRATTFLEMAESLFEVLKAPVKINWVDTPTEFRAGYQYKTEAQMEKLRSVGYTREMTPVLRGAKEYYSRGLA